MTRDAKPLLSICIPTYNRAGWLRSSLACGAPQVAAANGLVELVVSDNCSTDDTPRIVQEAQALGPIRYHRNETNIGGDRNVYRLVSELARGEYIWVMGDDDFLREGAVRRVVEALQRHPELDYFYANYGNKRIPEARERPVMPSELENLHVTGSPDLQERYVERAIELAALDYNCFTPLYTTILRRSLAPVAFEGSVVGNPEPFSSLRSVSSQAVYIVENLLHRPCYYIGYPCSCNAGEACWPQYLPVYVFVLLPQLFDLLAAQGVPQSVLNKHRSFWMLFMRDYLKPILRDKNTPGHDRFNLMRFAWKNRRVKGFWPLLLKDLIRMYVGENTLGSIRSYRTRLALLRRDERRVQ